MFLNFGGVVLGGFNPGLHGHSVNPVVSRFQRFQFKLYRKALPISGFKNRSRKHHKNRAMGCRFCCSDEGKSTSHLDCNRLKVGNCPARCDFGSIEIHASSDSKTASASANPSCPCRTVCGDAVLNSSSGKISSKRSSVIRSCAAAPAVGVYVSARRSCFFCSRFFWIWLSWKISPLSAGPLSSRLPWSPRSSQLHLRQYVRTYKASSCLAGTPASTFPACASPAGPSLRPCRNQNSCRYAPCCESAVHRDPSQVSEVAFPPASRSNTPLTTLSHRPPRNGNAFAPLVPTRSSSQPRINV